MILGVAPNMKTLINGTLLIREGKWNHKHRRDAQGPSATEVETHEGMPRATLSLKETWIVDKHRRVCSGSLALRGAYINIRREHNNTSMRMLTIRRLVIPRAGRQDG